MELDEQDTPQKLTRKLLFNFQATNQSGASLSPCRHIKTTPKNSRFLKKNINPRTPKGQSISYSLAACSSLMTGSNSSLHSVSMAVVETPPAKRYQRIRNPFEAALHERLHLPLIASPSLFQRPNTPQMSSTQFEWTIDDVSSLKPANVEANETQFQDSPDPELEAKAQSAISSFFKEQQIVPSPIDCPLRAHRIILSEINGNTPMSKPGRRIRDCAAQTELTLPPILPPALEEALKPYFQPHLAGDNLELKRTVSARAWQSSQNEIKDTSLRRKLFDMHNIVVLENEHQKTPQHPTNKTTANCSAHSNSSPVTLNSLQRTAIVGKLSDSLDKSSFGSLSPISPSDSATKRKIKFASFLIEEDVELLSPIRRLSQEKSPIKNNTPQYRILENDFTTNNSSKEAEDNEHFIPERSPSPLNNGLMYNDDIAEFSTASFNMKVSRLNVNSSNKTLAVAKEGINKTQRKSCNEVDIFDADDMLDNTIDMDDMQVFQLSTHSLNCSSSQSDTPRSKRRSASRKNLSQSFSANWLQDDDEAIETSQSVKIKEILAKKQFAIANTTKIGSNDEVGSQLHAVNTTPNKDVTFYRTDSGFNEMSQNSLSSCEALKSQQFGEQQQPQEILVCCSTPSKKDHFNFD